MENGESLLVARPGLRIWIADKFGKVRHDQCVEYDYYCLQIVGPEYYGF